MLDERKAAILRAVVEEYIATAQPVGSSHVANAPGVNVSSATVRNEMAVLEQEGYLAQPHTSAGRVPTDKGYRFFVDSLTTPGLLDQAERMRVESFFETAHGRLEEMLHQTSNLLAQVTHHAALVVGPGPERAVVRSVQIVGLSANTAMVVVVLSNGSVDNETIELPPDTSDVRLASATAHLQQMLYDSRKASERTASATSRIVVSGEIKGPERRETASLAAMRRLRVSHMATRARPTCRRSPASS